MATDIERLVVQLSADVKKYENALNRAMGVTNTRAKQIESRFAKMNANINANFSNTLRNTTALVGGALGTAEIVQYADAWTEAGNKIAAAAQISGVQTRSLSELRQGADAARTSFETYVDLYAKLIRSASGVAKSEEEIARATDIVTKSFKAGGASTQEQIAGILQLSQALGSGVLQGDELRSLRENAPLLAQAIADEFKTTIAGLKQLGADGKITSDRVFKAILASQKGIEAAFKATNATIGDSFTILKNGLTEYIGTTSQALGVTQTINGILVALAGNISSVANAAAAAGLVLAASFGRGAALAGIGLLLNPFVALAAAIGTAAYVATELWDNLVPLEGSFATLGDYAKALWQIMGEGAQSAKETIVATFDTIVSSINASLGSAGTSMSGVWEMVKTGVNGIIDIMMRMKDVVVAAFTLMPSAIADAVVGSMNTMIAGVEAGINKVISAVNSAISAINSLSGFAGISEIPGVSQVALSKIVNEYAGAGDKARAALDDAINRPGKDYLGAAGDNVLTTLDAIKDGITDRANQIAAARQEMDREAARAANFGGITSPEFKPTKRPATTSSGGGKKDSLTSEIQQMQDRTKEISAETAALAKLNPLVNDYGYSVAKAKAQQELLNAAQKAGRAITPELAKTIDAVSEAYARATAEAAKLAEQQQKAKEAIEFQKDLVNGALSDMRTALEDGKLTWEDLGNVAVNVLNKIADRLQTMLVDQLFSKGLGGLFGSLGGSVVGGLSGAGGGGIGASAAAAAPVAKMASAPSLPSMSKMAGAGQQVHVTVGLVKNGLNIEPEVVDVASRVGRAGLAAHRRGTQQADIIKTTNNPRRRG